ncbi:MAG: dTDP-4-dehydrorhamnose reductase [Magnetococcus sp. DMHC-6]
MKVLVVGASGQLGCELLHAVPEGYQVTGLSRDELDITDLERVGTVVGQVAPDVLINAAAYTAVDQAESQVERAFAVNAQGAGYLASVAATRNIRLIHISTDFIFDGYNSQPYETEAVAHPLNVYGASKWQGEQRIAATEKLSYVIVRTSWVYSEYGQNFVKTILRLLQQRDQLGIVIDQIGSPTWAAGLARGIWRITGKDALPSILHWSDEGVASWYDFAVAIQEEALLLGLLSEPKPIKAIKSVEYPLPARRPHYSVLDKSETWRHLDCRASHWRAALRQMLMRVEKNQHG